MELTINDRAPIGSLGNIRVWLQYLTLSTYIFREAPFPCAYLLMGCNFLHVCKICIKEAEDFPLLCSSIGRGRLGDRRAREICHFKGLNFFKLNLSITVYSSVKVCFVRLWVFLLLYYKAVARGGATGVCAPPFSKKKQTKKQLYSFVE